MIKISIVVAASILTATAALANPQVMSDEELDSVVAGALSGQLVGTLILPGGTPLATGATVDVADGLEGNGTIDLTVVGAAGGALPTGEITSTPGAP